MNPANVCSILTVGENFVDVLMKVAFSIAENGFSVWFISPQPLDRAPKNIIPVDKEILQLVTFMYLKDLTDLVTHLNGIHLWHKIPNVIIVIGFEIYCSIEVNQLKGALLVTSLLDSAAVCTAKTSKKVTLIVACKTPSNSEQKRQLQTLNNLYFTKYLHKTEDNVFYEKIMKAATENLR